MDDQDDPNDGPSCSDCHLLLAQEDPAQPNYGHLESCQALKPQRLDRKMPLRPRDLLSARADSEALKEAREKGYMRPDGSWLDEPEQIPAEVAKKYDETQKLKALICDEPTMTQATAEWNEYNHRSHYGQDDHRIRWYWSEDPQKIVAADAHGRAIFGEDPAIIELELRARFDEPGETRATRIQQHPYDKTWLVLPNHVLKKSPIDAPELFELVKKVGKLQVEYQLVNKLKYDHSRTYENKFLVNAEAGVMLHYQSHTLVYHPEHAARAARLKVRAKTKNTKILQGDLLSVRSSILLSVYNNLLGEFKEHFTWGRETSTRDQLFGQILKLAEASKRLKLDLLSEENFAKALERCKPYLPALEQGKDGFMRAKPRPRFRDRYDHEKHKYIREEIVYPEPTPEQVAKKQAALEKLLKEQADFAKWVRSMLRKIVRAKKAKAGNPDGKQPEVGVDSGLQRDEMPAGI